eukprot:Gb_18661 [translate_table: standard]
MALKMTLLLAGCLLLLFIVSPDHQISDATARDLIHKVQGEEKAHALRRGGGAPAIPRGGGGGGGGGYSGNPGNSGRGRGG